MDRTLPFYDRLMGLGRHFHRIGLSRKANALFERLTSFPDLPADYVEEVHFRLAEWNLDEGRYKRARRHLTAALVKQPDNAHYHYLMGLAAASDEKCDERRGLVHFRQAVRLDPDNASYLFEHGQLAISMGETRDGLKSLRRAAELSMDDPELLTSIAKSLIHAGEDQEAKTLMRTAMFRNSRDLRFRKAWQDVQFETLHGEQSQRKSEWRSISTKPILLPFPKPERTSRKSTVDGKSVRQDAPATLPGPHGVKKSRRPARKSN